MNEIPLFPLPLVLFPGASLELQIFEPRYLDMVRDCMRTDTGFGIVLIREGEQVLRYAGQQLPDVCQSGAYCRIIDFDQKANGMLLITVRAESRFVIRDHWENENRLMIGDVEFLPPEGDNEIPERYRHLVDLLVTLLQHESVREMGIKADFGSALEVSSRLTELVPCKNSDKQRLFELKDPVVRLQELDRLITRLQGGDT